MHVCFCAETRHVKAKESRNCTILGQDRIAAVACKANGGYMLVKQHNEGQKEDIA
jgi:hypothetical protein